MNKYTSQKFRQNTSKKPAKEKQKRKSSKIVPTVSYVPKNNSKDLIETKYPVFCGDLNLKTFKLDSMRSYLILLATVNTICNFVVLI